MAKGSRDKSKCGSSKQKSLASKKAEIDKLIEISKANSNMPPRASNIRLPPRRATRQTKGTSPGPKQFPINASNPPLVSTEPKQVVSGLPESENQLYFIWDLRSLEAPEVPLVRLPREPPLSRALRYVRKGHFQFLDLPGELRNKIYDYVIQKEHYTITWINGNHKSKGLTYEFVKRPKVEWPRLALDAAQRRRSLDFHHRRAINKHLPEDSIQPAATMLLLVCTQISEEAASVFYNKSMFHFRGLGALRHFLNHLRPNTIKSIDKISLRYRAYGNPLKTEDQQWKEKHDRLWESLCWRLTDECSLTQLHLDLTLNKSPMSFAPFDHVDPADLGAQWIRPLWAFQDAGIKRCWAKIHCASQDGPVLEVESWKMRKEILGELWDEETEASGTRNAYGFGEVVERFATQDPNQKGRVYRLLGDGSLEGA